MHVLPKAFTVSAATARSPVGIKALAAEIDVRLQLTRESLALHPQPHGGTQRSLRECRYRVVAIANRLSGWWATARLISMVRGFDPNGTRDIVFVPVGINYDHVLEDELLTAAASNPEAEQPHFSVPPLALTAWIGNELWQRIRGTWDRYGYACVGFGHPLSLRDYLGQRGVELRALPEEQRFAEIAQLGQYLVRGVGHVVPALPVPAHPQPCPARGARRAQNADAAPARDWRSWRLPVEPRRNSLARLLRQFHCPLAGADVGALSRLTQAQDGCLP